MISMIPSRKSRPSLANVFRFLVFCLLAFTAVNVSADLKPKQVRKSITRMPGFELTNGSVRVKSITLSTGATAEALAEIKTVFKLQKDEQGNWRPTEIRVRPGHWEEIDFIARALNLQVTSSPCTALDPPSQSSSSPLPTLKRARCLLGSLLGVEVPSDAIRIQQVSPLEIPMGSRPSAVVVAWIRADVRLVNAEQGWQVTELRTAKNDWAKLDAIIIAVNELKRDRARTELALIAKALESFRQERGFYVVSEEQAGVIDHLTPRYLSRIIRVDPWHQPYKYQGDRDHFTLRSLGPDGQENTADDIMVNQVP